MSTSVNIQAAKTIKVLADGLWHLLDAHNLWDANGQYHFPSGEVISRGDREVWEKALKHLFID